MKMKVIVMVLMIIFLSTAGCSIFKPFTPGKVISNPLGTDSLKVGMTKDQVKSILGDPDSVSSLPRTKDILSTACEEWIYQGRYTDMPLKTDYLGKTLILTFDGENLVSYRNVK
ncbi:MAG: hypothetical protein COZ98_02400 [Candidatus Omnitrophica bacterium CG_4_8_14_3_um_filter_43_15]|nr:MAG: hypothetical protein AUJ89_02815 [Candidatus Omnitrophica bacterium CG1_02_43_210]PIV12440.1 MAG: hypothetical protein COS48_00845 [Candidatus Omnitrophica bacterium CG03_land_8_20_14_0_80_43_22]PIW80405.1 MAG: hypothetical protein COZ98_02400 [Candidatus Omnitrophica bacterium CG_4_8_14_3_um_filter_43_15]PIY84665.1 MAG: hypothetical protein COY77_01135 [Candidatus Omnitrophica bacterium CG_4_10_14_0_8_um_filter_43_18]PJC46872.1 MAG: hypothetical protein CO036_00305 [Candidatus Omnitrop